MLLYVVQFLFCSQDSVLERVPSLHAGALRTGSRVHVSSSEWLSLVLLQN